MTKIVLVRKGLETSFHLQDIERADLPAEAELDNVGSVDGTEYEFWAMPDAPVVGRSMVYQMSLEAKSGAAIKKMMEEMQEIMPEER